MRSQMNLVACFAFAELDAKQDGRVNKVGIQRNVGRTNLDGQGVCQLEGPLGHLKVPGKVVLSRRHAVPIEDSDAVPIRMVALRKEGHHKVIGRSNLNTTKNVSDSGNISANKIEPKALDLQSCPPTCSDAATAGIQSAVGRSSLCPDPERIRSPGIRYRLG